MIILIAILLALVTAVFHHFALRTLRSWLSDRLAGRPNTPLLSFLSLVVIHFIHISGGGLLYYTLYRAGFDDFGTGFETALDFLHISAVYFSTVGFSELSVGGEIRFIGGVQAVLGFMVLTWSATFHYDICKQSL